MWARAGAGCSTGCLFFLYCDADSLGPHTSLFSVHQHSVHPPTDFPLAQGCLALKSFCCRACSRTMEHKVRGIGFSSWSIRIRMCYSHIIYSGGDNKLCSVPILCSVPNPALGDKGMTQPMWFPPSQGSQCSEVEHRWKGDWHRQSRVHSSHQPGVRTG